MGPLRNSPHEGDLMQINSSSQLASQMAAQMASKLSSKMASSKMASPNMASSKPASPFSAAVRPDAPIAGIVPAATSSSAGGSEGITFRGTESPVVSVDALMQHWGSSDTEYDLNSDGIVNGQDLSIALNSSTNTQSRVFENWGASGKQAGEGGDYNGDGSVNAMDLAMELNAAGTPRSAEVSEGPNATPIVPPTPQQMVSSIVDATFAVRDVDGDGSLLAQDFEGDNTKVFDRLDLDKSGGVGREELTKALLSELDKFKEQFPTARPEAFARRWMDTLTTGRTAPNFGQFQRMQQLFNAPAAPGSTSQFLSTRA